MKYLTALLLGLTAWMLWRSVRQASTPVPDDVDWYSEGFRDVTPWERAA